MYKIIFTESFEKKFSKIIPEHLQEQTKERITKLSENPFVGKPLKYKFIRELKIEKFRIYFIIFEQEIIILLADISNKKHQQKVINSIYENRNILQNAIKNLNNK
jgi:mRNA-degrading endonuclease RelE of RelBE toxin-antitoxin system